MNEILAIDAGNSLIKLGIFRNFNLIEWWQFSYSRIENMHLSRNINRAKISTVVPSKNNVIESFLDSNNIKDYSFLNSFNVKNLDIRYDTPRTLGSDRIALGIAGYYYYGKFTHKPTIIISCGTAITSNVVLEDGTFVGGSIMPGIDMMIEALHKNTDQLPPIENIDLSKSDIAKSSNDGILSGIVYAIEGFIENICLALNDCDLILTGGNARNIGSIIHRNYTIEDNLVLKGLALEENFS